MLVVIQMREFYVDTENTRRGRQVERCCNKRGAFPRVPVWRLGVGWSRGNSGWWLVCEREVGCRAGRCIGKFLVSPAHFPDPRPAGCSVALSPREAQSFRAGVSDDHLSEVRYGGRGQCGGVVRVWRGVCVAAQRALG